MASVLRQERRSGPLSQFELGRKEGFELGWDHGYWIGKCEAARQRIVRSPSPRAEHVMFVATGKGFPYSPLDEAVTTTLRMMFNRLTITNTLQPVETLAKEVRPDLVLVLDGLQFNTDMIDGIRQAGIRTAIWFTDDPYYSDITSLLAPHYDYVFTLEKNCIDFYRKKGCERVYYLPLGTHLDQFRPSNPIRSFRRDISFVGTGYWHRIDFFNQTTSYFAERDIRISGIWWDRLRDYKKLAPKIELGKWMGPEDTASTYSASKIVINMHRSHDDDTFNNNSIGLTAVSPNPRTFEISSCAALQITDVRDDIARFYTPDVEIVTYASPQEMIDKIEYYLHHEEERRSIAMRGYYRTLRDHTYGNRLEHLFAIVFDGQQIDYSHPGVQ
ncbi:spore maturation protein cgeB [Paenibacillaceae bacterium]|nr:spore maturation protein cgeB [Paenibacillaceae bacterium]